MKKIDSFLTSKWNRMRSLSLLCALVAFSYSGLSAEVRNFETGNRVGPLGIQITSQPSGETICEGENASFTVAADFPTGYTWQVSTNGGSSWTNVTDGGVYSNATTVTLNISGAPAEMNNYRYKCIVAGSVGEATSDVAILTVGAYVTYYEDFDNDGYGNGSETTLQCTGAPVGYVSNFADCDDNDPNVYPGAVEICYDGIDNNCDGNVDEGCVELTQIDVNYCGVTIEYLNTQYIPVLPVIGAEQYEFRITNGAYVATATDDLQAGKVRFLQFDGYEYNTTYQVAARAKVGGVWGIFGSECSVSTASFPHSELDPAQCYTTIPAMNTYIYTSSVNGATQYRFRIINGADVQTIDRSVRNFNMTMLASYEYNTTYTIDVAVEFGGSWWPYSASCDITTPSLASSSIVPSQCATTLSVSSANVNANPVAGATQYRFRLVNGAEVQTIEKSVPVFKFTELATYSFLTTYTIDVSIEYGGIFQPYGPACNITTPDVPTTQIQASQCGTSLPSMTTFFYATSVSGATSYRFRIIDQEVFTAQIIDNATRAVNITMFPVYKANTHYSVQVAALVNGTWGDFGPICVIATPAVPTQVKASQCGTTLSKIDKAIYADAVTNATQYRFRVTNGANVQTIDRAVPSFTLSQLANYAYGTSYQVDVASYYSGVWQPYGGACTVTTPAAGSVVTTLAPASCGITVSANTQTLSADKVQGASQYEFLVENAGLSYSQSIVRPNFTFNLSMLTGVAEGVIYTVKVRTSVNAVWSAYGAGCEVSTQGSGLRPGSEETASVSAVSATRFDAVVFPNPFGSEFGVNVSTSSEEMVNLTVYDMAGKLMSAHSISPQELGTLKIGADYAAGIYQVQVVQGTDVKTLKVVKQ